MATDYDLERFVKAQDFMYDQALAEIKSGRKTGHWIWYIFPQLKGFGFSYNSQYYGIADYVEAEFYANHPILGKRLREITDSLLEVLTSLNAPTIQEVVGFTDARKMQSCMTLFEYVTKEDRFSKILKLGYNGNRDTKTLEILSK